MHCFSQSEHGPSVPKGEVPNGPDERGRIGSSLSSPSSHPSPPPSCFPRCVRYPPQLLQLSFSLTGEAKQR